MHKYTFLLPLLLVFTFSCNAMAVRSASIVMPFSVSGELTETEDGSSYSEENDIDYTGVGFRYEETYDSVGLGVEFTPSATYTLPNSVWVANGPSAEFSSTEIGVFARKYLADERFFVEAVTMLGMGLEANAPSGIAYPDSDPYVNLKLSVGSRIEISPEIFGEISAGLIQTLVPATYPGYYVEESISAVGISAGIGVYF